MWKRLVPVFLCGLAEAIESLTDLPVDVDPSYPLEGLS
jgi:hypothetical protein